MSRKSSRNTEAFTSSSSSIVLNKRRSNKRRKYTRETQEQVSRVPNNTIVNAESKIQASDSKLPFVKETKSSAKSCKECPTQIFASINSEGESSWTTVSDNEFGGGTDHFKSRYRASQLSPRKLEERVLTILKKTNDMFLVNADDHDAEDYDGDIDDSSVDYLLTESSESPSGPSCVTDKVFELKPFDRKSEISFNQGTKAKGKATQKSKRRKIKRDRDLKASIWYFFSSTSSENEKDCD